MVHRLLLHDKYNKQNQRFSSVENRQNTNEERARKHVTVDKSITAEHALGHHTDDGRASKLLQTFLLLCLFRDGNDNTRAFLVPFDPLAAVARLEPAWKPSVFLDRPVTCLSDNASFHARSGR